MSFGRRPNASAIACTLSPTGLSRLIEPRARGPTAILRTYCSQTQGAGRLARSGAEAVSSVVSATRPLNRLYLLGACEDELEDRIDGGPEVGVRDHGHVVTLRAADDVVLDAADVVETVEVLGVRPKAFEAGLPDHEVRAVLLLVVDREHALDDEGALDPRKHPGHEVHSLEHHRPTFLEGALD